MFRVFRWCFGCPSSPQHHRIPPGSRPILFSHWKSSCPWRVRIALYYKNLDFRMVYIDLRRENGEQHREDFVMLSPMRQLPVLIIDCQEFIESMTILNYLEETRPYPELMPQDPIERARVREICELIVCGTQPLINLVVLQYMEPEKEKEWNRHWITRNFKAIEKLLEQSSKGHYCVGDNLSLADLCLVPQLHVARKRNIDLRPYPRMLQVDRYVTLISAFYRSQAERQMDKP